MARGDHERRHSREGRFRYYHGGFWYAEPWWTVGGDRQRPACQVVQAALSHISGGQQHLHHPIRTASRLHQSVQLRP
jgi:hypothetical protein